MTNISRQDSIRIIEQFAPTAVNGAKILENAVKARRMDKTIGKNFISTIMSPLTNELERYNQIRVSESYARDKEGHIISGVNSGHLVSKSKTNVLQTLGQLEKDAKFLKENYELHVNYLESYSDMTGTIQVNRVITAPMLYLTYMGSSGKDKIAFKATDTKLISRETKVRYYEIGGQLYEAPACFKNAELMKAVLGSNVRNGLVLVELDGAGFVNGRFTFDKYGTIAASTTTPGRYDFTKGTTAVDKEIYPYAEIKYLQFTDGTNKFIVPAGTDMAGDTLTMTSSARLRAKAKIVNPVTKKEGILHADLQSADSAIEVNVSKEVGLTGLVVEIKTVMFAPSLQQPVRSQVKKDVIRREINESIVQEFIYDEETKMLWHDLANIDVTSEALAGFHEVTVNAKDTYVFNNIHETLATLKDVYKVAAGVNATKSSAPMSGLVDGFVSSTLDFKASTDGTRFYQERQPAKFERLVEMMSTAHLYFQRFTQATSLHTNWGTNKSVTQYLTKQEASMSTEEVVAGVRPLNTVYHFEHSGNPMKVVVSEREPDWTFGQESVEINGYPVFMDENIENKCFYQYWTYTQDGETKADYRSALSPYAKPLMSIDNFGIVSYQSMAASILLKNIDV